MRQIVIRAGASFSKKICREFQEEVEARIEADRRAGQYAPAPGPLYEDIGPADDALGNGVPTPVPQVDLQVRIAEGSFCSAVVF